MPARSFSVPTASLNMPKLELIVSLTEPVTPNISEADPPVTIGGRFIATKAALVRPSPASTAAPVTL